MTPIYHRLERHMPRVAAQICLIGIYAFLMFAILLFLGRDQQPILYIDAGML